MKFKPINPIKKAIRELVWWEVSIEMSDDVWWSVRDPIWKLVRDPIWRSVIGSIVDLVWEDIKNEV